ncbi:MAG: hypothetical protein OHK0019_05020 [Saprospiraceae bacterium]
MKKIFLVLFSFCFFQTLPAQPKPEHNLVFDKMPARWDEALPLGNGLLGCLVWQKDGKLRLSLDRSDLWDTRPMKGLDRPEFSYQWVAEQVAKGNYALVQEYFDRPYEREAGPTKLPGTAVEFGMADWGLATGNLDISTGLAAVSFSKKLIFKTFVHAERQEGWFRLEGNAGDLANFFPDLIPPAYSGKGDGARLGYRQGEVVRGKNWLVYKQPCWGEFAYEVAIAWRQTDDGALEGVWNISAKAGATKTVKKALQRGFEKSFAESKKWWADYWSKSAVSVPDPLIERQYYLDLYKFGCAARSNAPMINLQSVWTADNGSLPPWKSDFHHDLNTQLSYWPAYASNHLDLAAGYLKHLEKNDAAHRAYTQRFFGNSGLNIPGVETLNGEPMGGWIQYACSPTTSAWLAQHFYLHWRYSQDKTFLKKHAWPFLRDVAIHLENISFLDKNGVRVLPLSSSPEINDNHVTAWFPKTWTNYDLALARFVFEKTAELADELKKPKEAEKWRKVLSELPVFFTEQDGELKIAPHLAHHDSHRHFSHLMAIHPLGLLEWERENDRRIIEKSLARLKAAGTDAWTGYSFAWLANLRARACDGNGARDALRIFAEAFVSKNSFHLNGDQSGKGYSKDTGRPFTLEGNFAFAAGVQEMLLQSQNGTIRVFPAVPDDWKDVSFKNLRSEGALLVSAEMQGGKARQVEIFSEKGGELTIQLPPGEWVLKQGDGQKTGEIWQVKMKKGESVMLVSK